MFVWLASYPKSGNTFLRSMLSAYFFSEDGIFNFDQIKNIKLFPTKEIFEKNGVNIKNDKEVIENYIKVQERINRTNEIQFVKTHSYLFNIENNYFTNLDHTLGVIYIVRDPRNVVTSWANHNNMSVDEASDYMINSIVVENKNEIKTYHGTWGGNFQSWKSFISQKRYLLIKYDDLINNKKSIFLEILDFIYRLKGIKFTIDYKKINNVLETTNFKRMKGLEAKNGFHEASINIKTGKKNNFFNLGPKNDWKKILDQNIRNKIEKAFEKEMKELGYL